MATDYISRLARLTGRVSDKGELHTPSSAQYVQFLSWRGAFRVGAVELAAKPSRFGVAQQS
jgi:hypothetical protein